MIEECDTNSESSNEEDLEPNIPIVNKNNPYIKDSNLKKYRMLSTNVSIAVDDSRLVQDRHFELFSF